MRNTLLAMLLLSLAGNAALLFYVLPAAGPNPSAGPSVASKSPAASGSNAAKSSQEAITPAGVMARLSGPAFQTDEGLRTLVASLRAAGFPPNVVRAVINELLNARFAERRAGPVLPFWQRPRLTTEQMAAQRAVELALRKEQQGLFESLLGPDARLSATLDARERIRRFGRLSDDKIDQIDQLDRDYNELRQAAGVQFNLRGTPAEQREKEALFNQEKRKDLAALLTPEELAQYDLHNSPAAQAMINNLGLTTVTEDEFKALYQLQQEFNAANRAPTTGDIPSETAIRRSLAQEQLNERVRTVLSDARFYDYLRGADSNYNQAMGFAAKYPSGTPAAAYELSKLERRAQAIVMQSRTMSALERTAAAQTYVDSSKAKVLELLGPEAAAAYQNQPTAKLLSALAAGNGIKWASP